MCAVRKGLPMSEKSYAEWRKAFDDIIDCIEYVYKHGEDL